MSLYSKGVGLYLKVRLYEGWASTQKWAIQGMSLYAQGSGLIFKELGYMRGGLILKGGLYEG